MRRLFHKLELSTSYIEKSSMTNPVLRRGRSGVRALSAQKFFYFKALRGSRGPSKAGAFQRCGGGSKLQGQAKTLPFSNRQRKGAVEYVPGAQRVDGLHGESRRLLQLALFIKPDRAAGAAGAREKGGGEFRNPLQRLAFILAAGGFQQRLTRKHQMSRAREQGIAHRHR